MLDSADLVGIEIGENSVCATVLSSGADSIMRYAEANLAKADAAQGDGLPRIDDVIQSLWRELGLDLSTNVRTAVAISHKHAGVGSGPTIESWIDSLGEELGQKLTRIGERFEGISYFPSDLLDEVSAAFEPLDTKVERIELAPIAAARCFKPKATCSFIVESGVSWLARVHSGLILEALVSEEESGAEGVSITRGETTGPLSEIFGLTISEELLASLRVSVHGVAVSVGAARGLVDRPEGNLLEGSTVSNILPEQAAIPEQAAKLESAVAQPETPEQADTPEQTATLVEAALTTEPTTETALPPRDAKPVSKDTEETKFRPLPPQHSSAASESPDNGAVQTTPAPLEPGKQRTGFEPSGDHDQLAVTPAFLPPTEETANPTTDIEPTAEPKNGSLFLSTKKRTRSSQKRANRSSTLDAQRPKIDPGQHRDEFPAEPFAGQRQNDSNFNLKLLTIGLAVLTIVGLLLLLLGPS